MLDDRLSQHVLAVEPSTSPRRFAQYRRLMDHWRTVLPVTIHEVDYELTVNDLESVARRLIEVCGLKWDAPVWDSIGRPPVDGRPGSVGVRLFTGSVGRWRNYESELAGLFEAVPEG